MTPALRLIAKAVTFQVPPRALFFGLMNKLNYLLRTGNRRYEFERLYLEDFDPWNYHTSAYERAKYERTLERILQLRRGRSSALEVGCSMGVFSGMLAENFDRVVSIDISNEALRAARQHNEARTNLRFVRTDLQALAEDVEADLIVCAEVLYYIREADADAVCDALERALGPNGVIVYVSGIPEGPPDPFYFHGWKEVLGRRFRRVHEERFDDEVRAWELVAFEGRA